MDQNKSLVQPTDFTPAHFQAMREMARTFIQSGAMPQHIKTPEVAIVVMQAGTELGIPPMQAIRTLYPVRGQIAMQWNIMSSRLRHGGVKITITEENENLCKMLFERTDTHEKHEETFTFQEAEQRGFTKKGDGTMKPNWKNMRKEMLRARCGSRGARFIAPDIIEGLYALEEMVDTEGGGARWTDKGIEVDVVNPAVESLIGKIKTADSHATLTALRKELDEIDGKSGITHADHLALKEAYKEKLTALNKDTVIDVGEKKEETTDMPHQETQEEIDEVIDALSGAEEKGLPLATRDEIKREKGEEPDDVPKELKDFDSSKMNRVMITLDNCATKSSLKEQWGNLVKPYFLAGKLNPKQLASLTLRVKQAIGRIKKVDGVEDTKVSDEEVTAIIG